MAPKDTLSESRELSEIFTKVSEASSKADAYRIVGEILTHFGRGVARTFSYGKAFAASHPECKSVFARSFKHLDWQDGQDLVQAEQGAGEDGFNYRFHRIEDDLDALGGDVRKAFDCLAEMRSELASRLEEIRAELNRVNVDIRDLQEELRGREVRPGVSIAPGQFIGVTPWLNQKQMYAFESSTGVVLIPTPEPVEAGPGDPRVRRTMALGALVEQNAKLKQLFAAGPVTKEDLVTKLEDVVTPEGFTVKDLVDVLPADAKFSSPEALVKAVTEREAASIRTSGFGEATVTASIGLADVERVADAGVENFVVAPPEVRTALIAAGVSNVGELAKHDAQDLATKLADAGVRADVGETASWIAAARTVSLIR